MAPSIDEGNNVDDWEGEFFDGFDRRGWSMRSGHCKRLKRQSGTNKARGRACFARTINSRRARHHTFNPWVASTSSKRCEIIADMSWQLWQEMQNTGGHGNVPQIYEEHWQGTSPWDRAVAAALLIAQQWWLEKRNQIERREASDQSKEKVQKRISTFEDLRTEFLNMYGGHIRDALAGVLGNGTTLLNAQLAPEIERCFMNECDTLMRLPANLIPVFHGTSSSSHASIFQRGLLIPSDSNGVRVAHGSAYGKGVYATIGNSVAMSRSYCSENRMLVCGLLDHANPCVVSHHSWGRVVFDSRRIVPMFEAVGGGLVERREVSVVSSSIASSTVSQAQASNRLSVSNGARRVLQNLAEPIRLHKPVMSRAVRAVSQRRKYVFMRRAARKRTQRKTNSVQIHAS